MNNGEIIDGIILNNSPGSKVIGFDEFSGKEYCWKIKEYIYLCHVRNNTKKLKKLCQNILKSGFGVKNN